MFVKIVAIVGVLVMVVSFGLVTFFVAAPDCGLESEGELKSGKYVQSCVCKGMEITLADTRGDEEGYFESKCLGQVESQVCKLVDEVAGEEHEVDCDK